MTKIQESLETSSESRSLQIRLGEEMRRRWVQVLEWDAAHTRFILNGLERRNRTSKAPVAGGTGPVVSLTTHGSRLDAVHLTIESIGKGNLLPSRLILWLDDERVLSNLPEPLLRLKARGLEVLLSENFGPHTKYYPYLEATDNFTSALVTADDDVIYPGYWLKRLAEACEANPQVVNCYRAHRIQMTPTQLAPYVSWTRCYSTQPSFRNFATGVSGCIYPAAFLAYLKDAGRKFIAICPKADDVWLHVNAVRAGFRIRQLQPMPFTFLMVPGTQGIALQHENVSGAQNDVQIQNTYGANDMFMIRS